jgi:hypothetical protein
MLEGKGVGHTRVTLPVDGDASVIARTRLPRVRPCAASSKPHSAGCVLTVVALLMFFKVRSTSEAQIGRRRA